MCLVGGVEKWEGGKLFCLVGEKSGRMENVIYMNWLLYLYYNKIPKGLISVKKWGYLCNLLPTSSFLLSFLPKLGGQNYVSLEGLFFTLFSFSLVFSPKPNKRKFHFLPYFPFFLFHPLCFQLQPNRALRFLKKVKHFLVWLQITQKNQMPNKYKFPVTPFL